MRKLARRTCNCFSPHTTLRHETFRVLRHAQFDCNSTSSNAAVVANVPMRFRVICSAIRHNHARRAGARSCYASVYINKGNSANYTQPPGGHKCKIALGPGVAHVFVEAAPADFFAGGAKRRKV